MKLTPLCDAQPQAMGTLLYTVTGWDHCGGGTGPTDMQDELLQALTTSVEKDQTPQIIEMHRAAVPGAAWTD